MELFNKYDKETLRNRLKNEPFERTTLSFYRYVILEDVSNLRTDLYLKFSEIGVLGRIYIAREGINAQISVPKPNWEKFIALLDSYPQFAKVDLKIAVEDNGQSFYKLIVRVRNKIVADGLND